jgi:hypothetical protein
VSTSPRRPLHTKKLETESRREEIDTPFFGYPAFKGSHFELLSEKEMKEVERFAEKPRIRIGTKLRVGAYRARKAVIKH